MSTLWLVGVNPDWDAVVRGGRGTCWKPDLASSHVEMHIDPYNSPVTCETLSTIPYKIVLCTSSTSWVMRGGIVVSRPRRTVQTGSSRPFDSLTYIPTQDGVTKDPYVRYRGLV